MIEGASLKALGLQVGIEAIAIGRVERARLRSGDGDAGLAGCRPTANWLEFDVVLAPGNESGLGGAAGLPGLRTDSAPLRALAARGLRLDDDLEASGRERALEEGGDGAVGGDWAGGIDAALQAATATGDRVDRMVGCRG